MKDLISREKTYEVLTEYYHHRHISQHIALREALDRVPDAECNKGEWVRLKPLSGGYWQCSACGFPSEAFSAHQLYKFCPNCGAYMKGE